jgi:hypothetical protein
MHEDDGSMRMLTMPDDGSSPSESGHMQTVLRGKSAMVLREIRRADVGLAIWQRSLTRELSAWLDEASPDLLPNGRILVRSRDARAGVGRILDASQASMALERRLFVDDVAVLVAHFARVTNSDWVDIRLQVVWHDACWRFHQDYVPWRLLTTYRGPATQFVAQASAIAALRQQRAYTGKIEELPRHAVALFKGFTSTGAQGVVHRSPPIKGTGAVRLVLCLNVPSSSSPEPQDCPGNGSAAHE